MKRLLTWVGVSTITFAAGFSAAIVVQSRINQDSTPPLQITVSEAVDPTLGRVHLVTIKNVSGRTVRGFSLGMRCDQSGRDIDDRPYADNSCYTNPSVQHQVLRPGESQQWPIPVPHLLAGGSKPPVWVDLVHFGGGVPNWGENKGHKDGYLRE
ncbi:MAG TPA: hypothetical protein VK475_14605 [Pyrinomonadaceae bacterium]|nr:hypothetical protein [Pyrinomonadaceae bacterium]